jgi:hypothetical protein
MAAWGRKETSEASAVQKQRPYFVLSTTGDGGKIPKGYLPILLVGDGDEEHGGAVERVLVHVKTLKDRAWRGCWRWPRSSSGTASRACSGSPATHGNSTR